MEKVVLDTNVILDNPYIFDENYEFVIPYVVLQELDGLKRNKDLSYNVRLASKNILDNEDKIKIINIDCNNETNDDCILQVARTENVKLFTNDIILKLKARAYDVDVITSNDVKRFDKNYKGYYSFNVNDIKHYYEVICKYQHLQHSEIEEFIDEKDIPINSYVILYPKDTSLNFEIFRKTKDNYSKVINNKKAVRGIKLLNQIELDPEILIALDAIKNETLMTVLQGQVGTGKSVTALLGSLIQTIGDKNKRKYEKIYVTRPPYAVDKELELGFAPGEISAKMSHWILGIRHALSFLIGEEETEKLFIDKVVEPVSLETIQGASFHNSILIVDEAQYLSDNVFKQIMTRVADTSKLILMFDPNQSYGVNRGREGYKKLLPYVKGNELVSFVRLEKVRRSPLTDLAIEIFDNE